MGREGLLIVQSFHFFFSASNNDNVTFVVDEATIMCFNIPHACSICCRLAARLIIMYENVECAV